MGSGWLRRGIFFLLDAANEEKLKSDGDRRRVSRSTI